MSVDRRQLIAGAVAGLLSAGATRGTTVRNTSAAGINSTAMFHKLRFRTDDGLIFWWLQGPKIDQVRATLTPLYTNSVGTIQRIRHRDDGSFDLTTLEMVLNLDLETGEPLQSWRNPYTGETLPVKFKPLGPTVAHFRADNSRVLPTEIGGAPMESSSKTHPPVIVGDDVFQRDESVARVFTPGRKTPFEVNDIAVYHGSLANLTDSAVTSAEATVFFAEVTGWQRWMNMGDRPGNLTSRLTGRKVHRYADLPETWRAQLATVAPKIAADPVGALDQSEARFDR